VFLFLWGKKLQVGYLKLSEFSRFSLSGKQALLRDAGFPLCLKKAKPKKPPKEPKSFKENDENKAFH